MSRKQAIRTRLAAVTRRPVTHEARERHLAAIEEAIREGATAPVPRRGSRRVATLVLVAALGVLPAGVAFAAESALPGEALYPVKRVTEAVRSLIDDDVVAEHRVEELEALLAAGAPDRRLSDQVDRTRDEVSRLAADHELRPRFDAVAADVARHRQDRDRDIGVADTTTTTRPVDRTTTTNPTTATTVVADGTTTTTHRPNDSSTTTATTSPVDQTTTSTSPASTTSTTKPTDTTVAEEQRVRGRVRAGPTCPVETDPPDPDCEDQPVAGAVLRFFDADGKEVAVVESNAEGRFALRLRAGTYLVEPQPDDRYLGTAPAQEFTVGDTDVLLDIRYDTGIR